MCGGGGGNIFNKIIGAVIPASQQQSSQGSGWLGKLAGQIQSSQPVVGQPDNAQTQIGATGVAAALRRKPRSLLSAAGALGDTSAASTGTTYAKPTLGS